METRIEKIVCPKCKQSQNITLWEQIDGVEDTLEKNHVLEGTLFLHTCKVCQFKAPVVYNSLYVNKDKHFAIYLSADRDEDKITQVMNQAKENDPECALNRRVVHGPNALREKAIIFEEGLNDRAIEIMKLFYVSAIRENSPSLQVTDCYFAIVNGQWRIEILVKDGTGTAFDTDRKLYDDIMNEYKDAIESSEFTYYVDLALAFDINNKNNKE